MRNRSNLEDGTVGSDHARNNFPDRAIDVVVRQGTFLNQRGDTLRTVHVAVHVDQAWLNDWVTRRRNGIVSTRNNVGFEHVIITQDVLRAADLDKRSERSAAAVAIGQVLAPAAGRA